MQSESLIYSFQEIAPLSEQNLEMIYHDLVAVPASEPAQEKVDSIKPHKDIVRSLSERLMPESVPSEVQLKDQTPESGSIRSQSAFVTSGSRSELLERMQTTVAAAERAFFSSEHREALILTDRQIKSPSLPINLGLASGVEWSQLIQACVDGRDMESAEKALDIMKVSSPCSISEHS